MSELNTAQLHIVAHDATVHGVLLMDLLRMVQNLDPDVFQRQVRQAERDAQEVAADPANPLRCSHSVLEDRLAFLRSVQIQANVAARQA